PGSLPGGAQDGQVGASTCAPSFAVVENEDVLMRLDFALLLVVLTALTGLVWLVDRLFFARGRAERGGKVPVVVDYSRSFFPVILAVLLFRSFLYEPFKIPSSSMMPTLLIGDYILVNKFAYGLRLPVTNTRILDLGSPKRADLVVCDHRVRPRDDYTKRVTGVPGDGISHRNKAVSVNGQEVPLQPLGRFAADRSSAVYNGYAALLER